MAELARLFRYRVTIVLRDEGRYQEVRCARHPIDAGAAVMRKLGLNQSDPHHPPLAMFVVPLPGGSS